MAEPSVLATRHFLVVFLLLSLPCLRIHALVEFLGHCGLTIDLMLTSSTQSGLLTMPLPETMDKFQDPNRPINCDIIITFTSGINLLIELYFVDIMPRSGDIRTCTTGLEIFDQAGRKYYGGRICMEGWQWEERHREKQQEKHLVQNSPLTFRLVSQGPYRGRGFKLHFNQIRPSWPCYIREYKCQQIQRCVHYDLTCDGWNDCGDYSDERLEAGCLLLTASEICAILIGLVLLFGATTEIVLFVVKFNKFSQEYGLKSEPKEPVADDRFPIEPAFSIGRRQNSQDSLPSRVSRSTAPARGRQDSDSDSVNKLDLEKAGRHQVKHQDETSSHLSSRRNRSQSQGTDVQTDSSTKPGQGRKGNKSSSSSSAHEKPEPDTGFDNNAYQQNSGTPTNGRHQSRDRVPNRDKDIRKLDRDEFGSSSDVLDSLDEYNDSRGRRGRFSDDDDSDRGRDYKRRRSNSRYSDDSDHENERRERRRSRERYSRDRYDERDDSDCEYERKERRRSRERYSRDRYDERDDSDRDYEEGRQRSPHSRNNYEKDRSHHREEDRDYKKRSYSYDDDDDDDGKPARRRRRSKERRHSLDEEQDSDAPARSGKRRSRSRDDGRSKDRSQDSSPPLPPPPPYSEEDTQMREKQKEKFSQAEEYGKHKEQYDQKPPPSRENTPQKQQKYQKEAVTESDDPEFGRYKDDQRDRYAHSQKSTKKASSLQPPKYTGIVYKEESV